jgi:hypothetical protein
MTEDMMAAQMILYAPWSAEQADPRMAWCGRAHGCERCIPMDVSRLGVFGRSPCRRLGPDGAISRGGALLVRCGYPLDKQPAATSLVMQHVELFAHWAADRRGRANLASGRKACVAESGRSC